MFNYIIIAAALCILSSQANSGTARGNDWRSRSGRSEALADLKRGARPQLYARLVAGEGEAAETPGVMNCTPDNAAGGWQHFRPLGVNYSESQKYSPNELSEITDAYNFARDYNLTLLAKEKGRVQQYCPAASLER